MLTPLYHQASPSLAPVTMSPQKFLINSSAAKYRDRKEVSFLIQVDGIMTYNIALTTQRTLYNKVWCG
jgi:hypothetical protein